MDAALMAAILWTAALGSGGGDAYARQLRPIETAPGALSEDFVHLMAYRAPLSGNPRERLAWAEEAVTVIRCESRFRPGAVGAASERGLLQLHPVHRPWLESIGYPWSSLYHAGTNLRAAWLLWSRTGDWRAWICQPH